MLQKQTVLLAEDDVNDVFMMRRALQKIDAPVSLQVARDGEQAILYLSGQNQFADRTLHPLPDLILLDINMPRKNGFDVMQWLKTDGTLTHIPIAMLTSSKVKNDMNRAYELGAKAYLVKPVPQKDLHSLFTATAEFLSLHACAPR